MTVIWLIWFTCGPSSMVFNVFICPSVCIRLSRCLQVIIHSIWSNIWNKTQTRRSFSLFEICGRSRRRVTDMTDLVTVVKPWQCNPWRHSRPNLSLNLLLSFVIVSSFCRLRSWMELKNLKSMISPYKNSKNNKVDQECWSVLCLP